MRRREFTRLVGGATVAWSVAAHAQQAERLRRIGVLTFSAESDQEGRSSVAAFREELRCAASGYMLMMSYISPLATACCTVATPSLRLAFSV
jgi:hypothetical protein